MKDEFYPLNLTDINYIFQIICDDQLLEMFSIASIDKRVLTLRLVEEKSFPQIAKELQLTTFRVNDIYVGAFRRIKGKILSAVEAYKEFNAIKEENERLKQELITLIKKFEPLEKKAEKTSDIDSELLNMSIGALGLEARTFNALRSQKIKTIDDLMEYDITGLLQLRNVGRKSVTDLEEKLAKFNLKLPI